MFETEEEKNEAQNNLKASIDRFNKAYDVMVDIGVFENAKSTKNANRIFIDTFSGLLEQAIKAENGNQNITADSMRVAFERDVIKPFRDFSIKKASANDVERVKKTLPDVNGGMSPDKWINHCNNIVDGIYWENIDSIANRYKNGPLRIRDMVSETNTILSGNGDISPDEVKKIVGYANALKRANESRSGIWKFFFFVRSNAEQRKAESIANKLKGRIGESAYNSALKSLTDPSGRLERLKASSVKQGLKLDFAAASNEKSKSEKVNESSRKQEKEQVFVDDNEILSVPEVKEEKVPGNERLYAAIGKNGFESSIKEEIWKALKLKESLTIEKKTVTDNIYQTLLQNAKSLNEDYSSNVEKGAADKEIHDYLDDGAKNMFSSAYLSLTNLPMKPYEKLIAAQKIADIMLNKLTVVGFEKEKYGKYGECYAVKDETTAIEVQMVKDTPDEDKCKSNLDFAINELEKERVNFKEYDSKNNVPISSKHNEEPSHSNFLRK